LTLAASIASQDRLCAWAAALGAATILVCVLGELAGPVRLPAEHDHDHGAGAPVQYFTPPAKPASPSPAIAEASPQVPTASPEVVAATAPLAVVPVTAMPALVPVTALRPIASAAPSRPVVSAAPSAERFVPDMPGDFPDPPYPRWARQQGVQGRLLVLVDVAASGAPLSVALRESSGQAGLDQHAADWVRRHWSWAPGAPRRYLVPFVFELQ
jgi:periplasmic protein TonB